MPNIFTVSIPQFTPTAVPIGTEVPIYGSGFQRNYAIALQSRVVKDGFRRTRIN
jgi:hypothetical protein